jgi:hypothetical protein
VRFTGYVCDVHRIAQKTLVIRVLVLLGAAIALGVIVGLLTEGGLGALTAFLVLIAGIIYVLIMEKRAGQLRLKRMKDGWAHVKGAGKPFLDSLE